MCVVPGGDPSIHPSDPFAQGGVVFVIGSTLTSPGAAYPSKERGLSARHNGSAKPRSTPRYRQASPMNPGSLGTGECTQSPRSAMSPLLDFAAASRPLRLCGSIVRPDDPGRTYPPKISISLARRNAKIRSMSRRTPKLTANAPPHTAYSTTSMTFVPPSRSSKRCS